MDPTWYKRSYGKEAWISETGMHSMPEASLFYETVKNDEFKGLGRMWDTAFAASHPEFIHHFTEYGPSRVPRMLSRASHISDMNDPTIESVSEATQIGAAEFYQVFSEKTQANYPVTTGLMPWVFKRHWPVIAIQLMDWFGHAGAPYYFMKRTYEPTHISIDIDRLLWAPGEKISLNLKIMSLADQAMNGFKTSVTAYDDSFKQIFSIEKTVSLKPGTTVMYGSSTGDDSQVPGIEICLHVGAAGVLEVRAAASSSVAPHELRSVEPRWAAPRWAGFRAGVAQPRRSPRSTPRQGPSLLPRRARGCGGVSVEKPGRGSSSHVLLLAESFGCDANVVGGRRVDLRGRRCHRSEARAAHVAAHQWRDEIPHRLVALPGRARLAHVGPMLSAIRSLDGVTPAALSASR